ncbi:MAG: hypothetical protein ABIZ80_26110, partial [Bryobacteraceae bacterium]
KAKQYDKALETGEKLVALDPGDVEAAHQNLKAAEGKKDPDLIRKWSDATSKAAVKMASAPQPKEAGEVETWKREVDYARQVNIYTEYALYATAVQTADPRKRIELVEALEQRNPKSEYLPKMYPLQFASYRQAGDTAKAFALAEKLLGAGLQDEDMLAFVADQYVQQKKDPEKVVEYANRLVEVVSTKPKPEGVSDEEWNKKKTMLAGLGNFMAGSTMVDPLKRYAPADKSLRAALPLVESNDQLKAATLFYLGLANYSLKNLADALKFNQQCAAIKSPFQTKANENVRVLRTQVPATKKKK